MQYISRDNLFKLLDALNADYNVYVPAAKGEKLSFKRYTGAADDIVIGGVRPFEPLKVFFSRSREVVANGYKSDMPHAFDKPAAIVGAKACDLKGFKVQDFVFTDHDYQDPIYIRNREENLIIASDCTCAIDTCFCLALGIKPYPEENFDISLSEVEGGIGFVVQSGSEKGKALIEKHFSLFREREKSLAEELEEQRERVTKEVENNIRKKNIPHQDQLKGVIEKGHESEIWTDGVKTCVECGACTLICPTCHCFLLYDQKKKERMSRLRVWDSCMIKNYARVAGGANPRPKLWMRLRNRFEKKFDFFPKVADIYACTGCGRCVSACPAKIDIREVLGKLVKNAQG